VSAFNQKKKLTLKKKNGKVTASMDDHWWREATGLTDIGFKARGLALADPTCR